jgi:hypothetical protein
MPAVEDWLAIDVVWSAMCGQTKSLIEANEVGGGSAESPVEEDSGRSGGFFQNGTYQR